MEFMNSSSRKPTALAVGGYYENKKHFETVQKEKNKNGFGYLNWKTPWRQR